MPHVVGCILIGAVENSLGRVLVLWGQDQLTCWVLCRLGQSSGAQALGWGERSKSLLGATFLVQLS